MLLTPETFFDCQGDRARVEGFVPKLAANAEAFVGAVTIAIEKAEAETRSLLCVETLRDSTIMKDHVSSLAMYRLALKHAPLVPDQLFIADGQARAWLNKVRDGKASLPRVDKAIEVRPAAGAATVPAVTHCPRPVEFLPGRWW